ncbi:extracellular solute-binding protein [Petroclostridium sp. X23]|uniref:extracellular solute-binding protein n=1 Tax=Petroclostridium sp. X23 TaxID=3045146 RepID=UPI0024AD6C9B|nr:extracellular solute-binding protein [Petroclostridium sp. X23]WHH60929.1 extracellular solute-binding protein [Petroclostridium sp. X23]
MRKHISIVLIVMLLIILSGCKKLTGLNSKEPVTLTLWHNYGGQMKNTMDEMIDEFNETIGVEKGIIINVTSISGSATLHEKLTMAANDDPGAPALPDITTSYPKTALILAEKQLLANLDEYFTQQELSDYIPEFLEEGKLKRDKLYVFPIAKSTEVLFVNTTIFNRFAKDTGANLEDLQTFEGIMNTSALYYDWTDKQTPAIPNDGKMFYVPDSLFNYSQIGYKQLGFDFINNGQINFLTPISLKVWKSFYDSAVQGRIAVFNGYASDLAKTGDIVCSTGSTAGVVFFSPTVTYTDNTSEPAELAILPYPIFEGGERIAVQRGAGMCIVKSTNEKESLASIFLKWFTAPQNNLRFVSSTGYLPVTNEAFGELMSKEIDITLDENIKKLLHTARQMQMEYHFYIPPLFDEVDKLEKKYESHFKKVTAQSKEAYFKLLTNTDPKTAFESVSKGKYEDFITELSSQ